MNIGTPDQPTVDSVRSYLREFLLDPDVIDIPYIIRQLIVRGIILRTRPKKIAPRYQSIWMEDGSPLRVITLRMAEELQESLIDMECEVGMRYGNPSIRYALEKLRAKGVEEIMLAPMFPQYAQATTESSIKEALRQLNEIGWSPEIIELGSFEDEPEFIDPLVELIKPHLKDGGHLLFSYHGLPLSHVKRMDKSGSHCQKVDSCCLQSSENNKMCYAHQCNKTTKAVVGKLGLSENEWSISYQSRLGPAKWLKPSTLTAIEGIATKGEDVVIVSPSFLVDGLETLEELDMEVREHYEENGGGDFSLVSCLNENREWIAGFSKLIRKRFANSQNSVYAK
tara:strand:- start:5708 stop:6724 length:1017 start_codon:yes stop_codon:yes gene_type:complete